MKISTIFRLSLFACLVFVLGCGKGAPSVRLADVVPITTETLGNLLVGDPNVSATQTAAMDKPLLVKGTFESVVVAADIPGFAHLSKGALSKDDITNLLDRVVFDVNRRLRRSGDSAVKGDYPPSVTTEKVLVATLTPQIQEGGSNEDKERGQGKTLILIRLAITDPKTGNLLAQRDYYSGTDARRPGDPHNRRSFKIRH